MVIRENGEIVEITNSKNDLHNTYSSKNHKPHFVPSYKNLYVNQLRTNKGLLLALSITVIIGLVYGVGCHVRYNNLKAELRGVELEFDRTIQLADDNIIAYNELLAEYASCSAKLPQKKVSIGKVSYYSKDGCLGCSANQTMANGQIFDENAMTLAHNRIPLNTKVKVINQDNGLFAYATVTDRGGFEKYGRIADLSKGLYEAIGAKTDVSNIQITWY